MSILETVMVQTVAANVYQTLPDLTSTREVDELDILTTIL
jgi:hypothetical protein